MMVKVGQNMSKDFLIFKPYVSMAEAKLNKVALETEVNVRV
jgi:hypothetical protein